mgnify:CR=1 FL=1
MRTADGGRGRLDHDALVGGRYGGRLTLNTLRQLHSGRPGLSNGRRRRRRKGARAHRRRRLVGYISACVRHQWLRTGDDEACLPGGSLRIDRGDGGAPLLRTVECIVINGLLRRGCVS